MPAVTSQFVNLLEPILREAIFMEFARQPDDYLRIANVMSSGKNKETDVNYSDLGNLSLATETEAVNFENPVEGFKKEYEMKKFFGGFQVSEELVEDDLFNIINRYPGALARSAATTLNVETFAILANAFNVSFPGPDGKPLIAADHPLINDSVNDGDNSFGAVDLAEAGLIAGINKMERVRSESGHFTPTPPRILIVSTEDQFNAQKLLRSSQEPGTDHNDVNALLMKGLAWMATPYLTNTNAWFLRADEHQLNLFVRRPLRIESTFDFDTGNMKTKATIRFDTGFSHWRGWGGSTGV